MHSNTKFEIVTHSVWFAEVMLKCRMYTVYCFKYLFHLSSLFIEQQKSESQHFPSRQFIQRRPGPPTMVPSKNHGSNPLTNQLASINALFSSTQSQAILQGHSHSTPNTSASGSSGNGNSATRSSMSEMSGHSNIGPGNVHPTNPPL